MNDLLAGVDIGGTSVAVRLADDELRSVARISLPTVRDQPDGAARQVVDAIAAACSEAGVGIDRIAAVGIGVPGQVDPAAGTVSTAVNLGWEHVALGPGVSRLLGAPCAVENDVRAAADGVRARRVLGDRRHFVFIAIGTGIAAGLIIDDRLFTGSHGLAGEVGHLVIDPAGPVCACGQRGCLETIASGPGVAAIARRLLATGAASSLAGRSDITAADVYAASAAGDAVAGEAVRAGARALARALYQLAVTLDIDAVAIGGGVAAAGPALFEPLERELDRIRASSDLAATVLPPDLVHPLPPGDDAGTWGAVLLARKGRTPTGARMHERKEVGEGSNPATASL